MTLPVVVDAHPKSRTLGAMVVELAVVKPGLKGTIDNMIVSNLGSKVHKTASIMNKTNLGSSSQMLET